MNDERLLKRIDELADSPNAIRNLRKLILSLAASGRLVEQSQADTPAGELLKQIEAKRAELVASKSIPKSKPLRANEVPTKELPAGWIWVQFGDATFCRDGERIPLKKADRDSHKKNFDYYGASGVIDKVEKFLFDKPLLLIGEDGANLVNRSTPIAFMAEGKYWVNNHAHVLDAINRDVLEYLRIYINSISLEPYITGMAQPKMNQARMNSIPVPLPPLAEQKRIVAKVDQLMALCDRLEAQQQERETQHTHLTRAALARFHEHPSPANLNLLFHKSFTIPPADLRKTILQLAVQGKLVEQRGKKSATDEFNPIEDVPDDVSSAEHEVSHYTFPSSWRLLAMRNAFEVSGGIQKTPQRTPVKNRYPYLRVANVQRGRLLLDDVKEFELLDGELDRWGLKSNDLLVVEGNGSEDEIGRCAIWNGELENCVHQNHIIRCRPVGHDGRFAVLFLNSPIGIAEMKKLAITTSGLFSLSVGKIRKIVFPFPPIEEQERIVTKVESLMKQVDHLEAQLTQSRATAEKLMEAIVAKLTTR